MSTAGYDALVRDLRARLGAAACSVAVVTEDRSALRYVAADGVGAEHIVGVELPVHRGLAGWVATSGQSIAVREVRADPRFAADVAEQTTYLPDVVLAAPFPDGVITVLDPDTDPGAVLPLRELEVAAGQLADPDAPAWSSAFDLTPLPGLPLPDVEAWGSGTGAGVKVAIIDSGVDAEHPRVGGVAGAVAFEPDDDAPFGLRRVAGAHEDLVGHGTACAGIVRALAPDVEIHSVRVLGPNLTGRGSALRAGIAWAVENGMQVANLSLSSRSTAMFGPLHEVADAAYFGGTVLVSAAGNTPGATYPSQFASVVSVAACPGVGPGEIVTSSRPPVEFGALGLDVDVPWANQESLVASGNSFAAPQVTGLVARLLSARPGLAPYQVKSVLRALSRTVSR